MDSLLISISPQPHPHGLNLLSWPTWLSSPRALCVVLPHRNGPEPLLEEVIVQWQEAEEVNWQVEELVALEGVARARRGVRWESQGANRKPSTLLRCFTGGDKSFVFT